MSTYRTPVLLATVLLGACSLSPVHRKIRVGEEPFVVFVAEGTDLHTDLFAALPTGGTPVRLTFTPLVESSPRLTSRGDVVAFLRTRRDSNGVDLVVFNLLNGAERLLELPDGARNIEALGWSDDDRAIYLRTTGQLWRVEAPPADLRVTLLEGADADTAAVAVTTRLGTPRFATAMPCVDGGICVVGPTGVPTRVSATGSGPFRWGGDSLAWFDGDEMVVRPLGGGTARRLSWETEVVHPREGSYAAP